MKGAITCKIIIYAFTNTSAQAGCDTGVEQVWIQSFLSPRLIAWLSLSHYLPTASEGIIGFIPFPRVLVVCEIQSVSPKIWTCVTVSISYDDNITPQAPSTKLLFWKVWLDYFV